MSPEVTYLLQSLGTVAAFGGVAWLAMAGLRRLGVSPARGPLEVVARAPLDGKRAIYLVRVGKKRVLVVGAGDSGLSRLGSLSIDELELAPVQEHPEASERSREGDVERGGGGSLPRRSFAQALGRVLRPVRGDSKRDG
jgi:flagellar biogenesis protein FliO